MAILLNIPFSISSSLKIMVCGFMIATKEATNLLIASICSSSLTNLFFVQFPFLVPAQSYVHYIEGRTKSLQQKRTSSYHISIYHKPCPRAILAKIQIDKRLIIFHSFWWLKPRTTAFISFSTTTGILK